MMFKAGRTLVGAALTATALASCIFPSEATKQVAISLDPVPRLVEGDTVMLSAHVVSDGTPVPNSHLVFSVADAAVAAVSSTGRLIALNNGVTTVTVAVAGLAGVSPAEQSITVHARVELDSVSAAAVAFGDTLTVWGAGLDLGSLYNVQLGGFTMLPRSYVPADPAHPERYGALSFWVTPPAGPQSQVQVTTARGSREIPTPVTVVQHDRFEPNDSSPAPLTLPFFNPALALETPRRGDLKTDWYSFTLTTPGDVSVRIRSPYVASGNVYSALLTDSLYWSSTQSSALFGSHAWAVGSGFGGLALCNGHYAKWGDPVDGTNIPFQAPANVDLALGNLVAGTYHLYISYSEAATIPIPYSLEIAQTYRSVIAPDAFEENDYCSAAASLSNALAAGGSLSIDNPLDLDWFTLTSPVGGETAVLQVDAPVDTADIDMYFIDPASDTVVGEPGVDGGPQELIATPLSAGTHYFLAADYAGVPTNYHLSRVAREHEPNNDAAHADTITLRDNLWTNIWGEISTNSDIDFVVFHADAGSGVDLLTRANSFDSPLDTYITLRDSAGKSLATDDDGSFRSDGGHDSWISYSIQRSGWYRLAVRSYPSAPQGGAGYFYVLQTYYTPPSAGVLGATALRGAPPRGRSVLRRVEKRDVARAQTRLHRQLPRALTASAGGHR